MSAVSIDHITSWPSDRDRAALERMKIRCSSWRHVAIGELSDRDHLK